MWYRWNKIWPLSKWCWWMRKCLWRFSVIQVIGNNLFFGMNEESDALHRAQSHCQSFAAGRSSRLTNLREKVDYPQLAHFRQSITAKEFPQNIKYYLLSVAFKHLSVLVWGIKTYLRINRYKLGNKCINEFIKQYINTVNICWNIHKNEQTNVIGLFIHCNITTFLRSFFYLFNYLYISTFIYLFSCVYMLTGEVVLIYLFIYSFLFFFLHFSSSILFLVNIYS